jgi:hypothetical protein
VERFGRSATQATHADELQLLDLPSLCTLWAYHKASDVRVTAPRARANILGRQDVEVRRCSACGCITHWEPIRLAEGSRMGVNARNFEPSLLGSVRIRRLDGASTWKYLD